MTTYRIQLQPTPDCRTPGIIGLRRLLKVLLRSYGFQCVDATEVSATHEIILPNCPVYGSGSDDRKGPNAVNPEI
jgi:hypothetical protein